MAVTTKVVAFIAVFCLYTSGLTGALVKVFALYLLSLWFYTAALGILKKRVSGSMTRLDGFLTGTAGCSYLSATDCLG